MAEAPRLPGIAILQERYDLFLVDQFGTLHDGQSIYPGALEALERLSQAGKRVVLLSNSGKRAAANIERLARLGVRPDLYDLFMSSGEAAWRMIASGEGSCDLAREIPDGGRALLLSRDGDLSPVEGLKLMPTAQPLEADLVIIAGSEGERFAIDHYAALLAPAARRDVLALCLNPDREMITPSGPAYGAGVIAELYESLGGRVVWVGKPYPEIYDMALAAVGDPPRSRVLAIGDSVEHDIGGAKRAGCDAALVLTGIAAHVLPNAIAEQQRRFAADPDFVLDAFAWR